MENSKDNNNNNNDENNIRLNENNKRSTNEEDEYNKENIFDLKEKGKNEYQINVIEKAKESIVDKNALNLLLPREMTSNKFLNEKFLNKISSSRNASQFSKEMIDELDNYFKVVKLNKDLREKYLLFESLYEKYKDDKDYVYILFWYPFINSDETMSVDILNTTKVYMDNVVIENIFTLSISSKELNNYAFELAIKNNFSQSLTLKVITQGKIKLSMEWLTERIKEKNINLLEDCWLANNDCYFESPKFSQKFLDFYRKMLDININNSSNNFRETRRDSVSVLAKSLLGTSLKKANLANLASNPNANGMNDMNGNSNMNSNNNNNNNALLNSTQKEYQEFFSKNVGKLTISKLILLTNYCIQNNQALQSTETREELMNLIRAICIFDKEKKFSDNILEGLYITKNKEIAAELLEANLLNVNISVFQTALNYKDLKFCLQFYNRYSDFKIFDKESLHDEIIEKVYDDINNMEVYLFFIKNFSSYFRLNTTKTLVKIIEDLLQVSNQNNRIVNNFSNPIKIFVLIAEILNRIKSRYPSLDSNIQRIIQKCLDYSENIQNLIEDDSVFRELLLERDLTKRSLLDIISQNNFLILLKNKLIEKIVDDLWTGPYDIQGSFLEVSSQYRSLNVTLGSKDYDIYTKQRTSLFSNKNKNHKSNFTHFKVWQRNIYSKYFVEILIGLLLIIYGQGVSFFYINSYKTILDFDNLKLANYSTFLINLNQEVYDKGKAFISNNGIYFNSTYLGNLENIDSFQQYVDNLAGSNSNFANLLSFYNVDLNLIENLLGSRTLYLAFYENISEMNKWKNYLDILLWIFFLLPFDYIMRIIYNMKARKPNFGLTLYPDIFLFIFAIAMKIMTLDSSNEIANILSNLSYDSINDFNYLPYLKQLESFIAKDPYNFELIALSVLCGLLWLRFILQIRGTKTFGPIIVIFLVSLRGVFKYIILFLLITFAYSCVAYLLFYRIEGFYYKNPYYAFMYFFLMSLGGDASYSNYSDLQRTMPYIPFLAGIFIALVLVLNVIVFFNLIIALLSNIFETYQNYSLQLYIQKKLEIRKKYYDDEERFNSLLVSYFPFNILTFPFALSLLFMVDKVRTKKLNKFMMYVNYSLYAFFYTLVFGILTICLMPFTYLKISYSKFIQIFVDEVQQYFTSYKVISFIFFLIFGLVIQLKSFVIDIINFFKELWKKKIPLVVDSENTGKYSIKTDLLRIIVKLVKNNSNANNNIFGFNINGSMINNQVNGNMGSKLPSKDPIAGEATNSLKISLEKFLFIISKCIDPNADEKFKENLRLEDYSIEKEKQKKKAAQEAEGNNFNFNVNFVSYSPIFEKLGYNYSDILDYLFNFCDDKYIIDISSLINIISTGLNMYEVRLFYANISDKNYKNYTTKKQLLFFNKIDSIVKVEKKPSLKAMLKDLKNSQVSNAGTIQYNQIPNPVENSTIKNLNDFPPMSNDLKLLNEEKKEIASSITDQEEKSDIKKLFNNFAKNKTKIGKKNYAKKIMKSKNIFILPDICSIPLLTRTCIVLFYNDLKEYQNDLSKKISDNIMKNQKYLEDIVKLQSNKESNPVKSEDAKKKSNKGGLFNIANFNRKKSINNTNNNVSNIANIDSQIKRNSKFKIFEKAEKSDNNTNNYNANANSNNKNNLDTITVEKNLEARISMLENKMEKLLIMTENIFKIISTSKSNKSEDSVEDSISKSEFLNESIASSSTRKIDKYSAMSYSEIE